MLPAGRGRMARSGDVSALVYLDGITYQPWVYLHDESNGSASHVRLPVESPSPNEWWGASYVLTDYGELTILSGNGPVYVRTYQLAGTPLATQAALISTRTFGDPDSRAGPLTELDSGALVGVWRQQGQTGPQGMGVAHRAVDGTWSSSFPIGLMPTTASKQVVLQHPVDGSVWIFNNADAASAIGAARLTESGSGLTVDWVDSLWLYAEGAYKPDPENPDLVGAVDPSTGTIVLAYQSAVRKIFSVSPFVAGSHVAVARVSANGARSYTSLPIYVERIAPLALVVRTGEVSLAYRPIDLTTLNFGDLSVSVQREGTWSDPVVLGTLSHRYNPIWYASGTHTFLAKMADGRFHWFELETDPATSPSPSPTSDASSTPAPDPEPTPTPEPEPPAPDPSEEPSPSESPAPEPTAEPTSSPDSGPQGPPSNGKVSPKCKGSKNERCT